jgi:hypothetical protein
MEATEKIELRSIEQSAASRVQLQVGAQANGCGVPSDRLHAESGNPAVLDTGDPGLRFPKRPRYVRLPLAGIDPRNSELATDLPEEPFCLPIGLVQRVHARCHGASVRALLLSAAYPLVNRA